MFKFLKWVGIAALISLPVILAFKAAKNEVEEDSLDEDLDIFGDEFGL